MYVTLYYRASMPLVSSSAVARCCISDFSNVRSTRCYSAYFSALLGFARDYLKKSPAFSSDFLAQCPAYSSLSSYLRFCRSQFYILIEP